MKTDYCTWFPEVVFGHEIWRACKKHDHTYGNIKKYRKDWGYWKSRKVRFLADKQLLSDVLKISGHPYLAILMFFAVRAFAWIALR